jgi:hypothetical protein
MTWLQALYAAAGVAALGAGIAAARRRWDAVGPVIWWREQRLHRRPSHIIGRLLMLPFGAGLLVGSVLAAVLLLGVLVAGLAVGALLLWAWWRMRCAARACAPRLRPHEYATPDPGDQDDDPDDPTRPRALEL